MATKARTKGLLLASFAAAAAAFGLLRFLGSEPATPAAAELRAAQAEGLRLQVAKGEAYAYAVELTSTVKVDAGMGQGDQGQGSRQEISLSVRGIFECIALAADERQLTVAVRLAQGEIQLAQNGVQVAPLQLAASQRALGQGLTVIVGRDGVLKAQGAAAPADELAAKTLLQVASLVQAKLPQSRSSEDWRAEELDGSGAYSASYTRTGGAGDELAFTKTKSGYSQLFAELGTTTQPFGVRGAVDGALRGTLDLATGLVRAVEGEETSAIYFGAVKTPYSVAVTRAKAELRGKEAAGAERLARVDAALKEATKERATALAQLDELDREAQARRDLGSDTLGDVRRQREAALTAPAERSAQALHDAFVKTTAWIELNKRDLSELRESMRGRGARDDWFLTGMNALAFSGCDECQKALLEEVQRFADDPAAVVGLIPYLAEPRMPTVASERLLRSLAESDDVAVRHGAQLALGTMAERLRFGAPERSEAIVKDALGVLGTAGTPQERVAALSALGNSGSSLLASALQGDLRSDSEDVRAAAVVSLRFCKDDEAVAAVQTSLGDASPKVREAAIEAIGFLRQTQENAVVLARHLGSEQAPALRQAIIARLQNAYASVPEARAAIDEIAQADRYQEVRNAARSVQLMHGHGRAH